MVLLDQELSATEARVLGNLILFLEPFEVLCEKVGVKLSQELHIGVRDVFLHDGLQT